MNRTISTKITLDFLMILVFLLLQDASGTGLVFHEIAGLFIFVLFIAHILLNWSWVKISTRNLLRTKNTIKPRLMYILNLALLLGTSIIFLTGIRISQVIFPSGSNGNSAFLVSIHKFSSYFCLVLIAIHLFLHRSYIWAFMRSVFAQREIKTALTLVTGIIIGTLCTKTLLGSDKQLPYTSTPPSVSSRSPANPPGNDDSGNPILQDTQAYGQTMSLSDFLGNMFCTGCSKHCSLLNLRCDRGNAQLQAAKIEYQNLYGQIPADSTTDPTQENSQNFEIPPQNGEEMYSKGAQHRNKGSHGSAHRFF